jgi:hypothetical protein
MSESVQVRPFFDLHRRKFGHEASQKELSAVTHVARDKGIPPFLLLHVADFPESRTGLQAQLLAGDFQGSEANPPPPAETHHGSSGILACRGVRTGKTD